MPKSRRDILYSNHIWTLSPYYVNGQLNSAKCIKSTSKFPIDTNSPSTVLKSKFSFETQSLNYGSSYILKQVTYFHIMAQNRHSLQKGGMETYQGKKLDQRKTKPLQGNHSILKHQTRHPGLMMDASVLQRVWLAWFLCYV